MPKNNPGTEMGVEENYANKFQRFSIIKLVLSRLPDAKGS